MVRFLLFISIILLLNSCILDQKLVLNKSPNESSSLRLDGIYLHEDSLEIVDLFFLYKDGTILSRGSVHKANLEDKLSQLEVSTEEKYKAMKYLWGTYSIQNETITFEKWASSDKPYRAFRRTGKILNDTTFVITQFSNVKGKGLMNINETYRFRKTKTKPDNSNKWIRSGD